MPAAPLVGRIIVENALRGMFLPAYTAVQIGAPSTLPVAKSNRITTLHFGGLVARGHRRRRHQLRQLDRLELQP